MKIAQIAPLAEAVPPRLYGGTERVVSWLTEELVSLGHDVTLFAAGGSRTKAKLVEGSAEGLRLQGVRNHDDANRAMIEMVRAQAHEFDMIHCHIDILHYPVFKDLPYKTVTTLHGRLDLPEYASVYRTYAHMPMISISHKQREPLGAGLNWLATIHHGLPPDLIGFNPHGGGYLAFAGRISPEKRPDRAIEIAIKAGIPLKMAAKVDAADQAYFDQTIKPMLDHPLIEFIGEIGDEQKARFMGNALALLFPIDWIEPFGLVTIEAMAAGTPVIAWRNGSVPEIVTPGVNGEIVESIEEAVAAVSRIRNLSRAGVRHSFESRFTSAHMARGHIAAYERLIAQSLATGRVAAE